MSRISVSGSGDHFSRDGRPFFYLADTVWSAFSNARTEEWIEYLDYRKAQGFNALQISVLPVLHDASDTYVGLFPFEVRAGGIWDFSKPNAAFFEKSVAMVKAAVERGFIPALTVLWGNYVKDTRFSRRDPSHVMPLQSVRPYAELVAKSFAPYGPIYLISGDTDFLSDATSEYYRVALEAIKSIDPMALTTFHLQPGVTLPEQLARSERLDFYMYQAGHRLEEHHFNYTLAEDYLRYPVKRPIVNGEPSYEGHGHGMKYGRFDEFHVRKAFWQSVLSGAKAGFTYGAHGVWSWHKRGSAFTSEEWSKIPFDWRTALRFKGGWDVGHSKWLFEQHAMHEYVPRNDLLVNAYPDIRIAASPNGEHIAVYVPYSNDVRIRVDLSGYSVTGFNLKDGSSVAPSFRREGEVSVIEMVQANADCLVVASRR